MLTTSNSIIYDEHLPYLFLKNKFVHGPTREHIKHLTPYHSYREVFVYVWTEDKSG